MSRRKNKERFLAIKKQNPDYVGFRGPAADNSSTSEPPLDKVACSRCGRTRNVPVGVALEHRTDYVCSTCKEESEIDDATIGSVEKPEE